MEIPYRKTKNGIRLEIKVEPKSSRKGLISVMENGVIKVSLSAPPVEGAANEQLIEVLSEAIGVKKSRIKIVRGMSSKLKLVEISGVSEL